MLLAQRRNIVAVFQRGTRAAAAKGSWRKASFKIVTTAEIWTLWASSGAANSAQLQTEDGVVPLDMADSSSREVLLGPAGAAY